jgi:hypothetical protein
MAHLEQGHSGPFDTDDDDDWFWEAIGSLAGQGDPINNEESMSAKESGEWHQVEELRQQVFEGLDRITAPPQKTEKRSRRRTESKTRTKGTDKDRGIKSKPTGKRD